MAYYVSYAAGEVNFEALPVAKITEYPLEKADYKPFAQCILCAVPDGIWLRMWAFEVFSSPESELRAVLKILGDTAAALHVRVRADSPVRADAWVELSDGQNMAVSVSSSPFNGEDLQGVYWGASVFMSYDDIRQSADLTPLVPGATFPGNFYKMRTDEPYVHMGSYIHANFSGGRPFDSLGVFEVVSW